MQTGYEKRHFDHRFRHSGRRGSDYWEWGLHPKHKVPTRQALAEELFHADASLDHLLTVTYGPRPMVMRSIFTTATPGFDAHTTHEMPKEDIAMPNRNRKPMHIARPRSNRVKLDWKGQTPAPVTITPEEQAAIVRDDEWLLALHEDDALQGVLPTQMRARKLTPNELAKLTPMELV